MRTTLLNWTVCAALLALASELPAHGGMYRGPEDVVPPNPGGGGGRGPTPGTPTTPNGGVPTPPNPLTPRGTARPAVTPGPQVGPMVPGQPRTGGGNEPDLTRWQYWWEFNKDPYLNLKRTLHANTPVSGSDEIYMGAGRETEAKDRIFVSERAIMEQILPALGRALEGTTNRDIVSSSMIALAKIGRNDAGRGIELVRLFKKRLVSGDQEVRETAALAMGLAQREEALDDLLALVQDSAMGRTMVERSEVDDSTRSFATYALGLLAYSSTKLATKTRALDEFEARLCDERSSSRNLKVAAILGMRLLNPQSAQPANAVQPLLERTCAILNAYWAKELGRSEQLIQAHVPTALAHLVGRGNDAVHKKLKSTFREVLDAKVARKLAPEALQSCAIALGLLGTPSSEDAPVIETLGTCARESKDLMTKHFATVALGEIGGEQARAMLLDLLARGQKVVTKPWAGLALGVLAHRARLAIGENAPSDLDLGRALHEELRKATAPDAKSAFALALGLAGYHDAASDLRELLVMSRKNDELCGYVAIGLALLDDQRSVEELLSIVKSALRRPDLLKQSAVALGKLGDKQVTSTLLEMLTGADLNIAKLAAVATAFSFIGDRRTIDPLVKILFDDKLPDLSRAFAAVALGGIADKELLPWNSKIACDLNYRACVETLTNQATGILDIL